MKKQIALLLFVACFVPVAYVRACCECNDVYSHSFFSARPQGQTAMPEKITMMRDKMFARQDGRGGAFQMALFGGRSTNDSDLARFFSPSCKTKLMVKELGPIETPADDIYDVPDIIARHFRILTVNGLNKINDNTENLPRFESTICFAPRQSTFGIGLTWKQDLTTLMNEDEEKDVHWWFEASSPLTYIKNDMRLDEKIINTADDSGGKLGVIAGLDEDYEFFDSMEAAFKQKAWKYGKINCSQTKWRLADIELKLGLEWIREDTCRLEGYWGFLIPTGNKPTAEFMFEPIVGHNSHFGIMNGGSACFKIWENEDEGKVLRFAADMQGLYLFSKNECRSFDVKCKPWSRYMEVYKDKEQAQEAENLFDGPDATKDAGRLLATPGINVFTRDLKVSPRLSCNSTSALIYTNEENGFRGEAGYNFYCRQKECVELACAWDKEVVFKDIKGSGFTAPLGTIGNNNREIEIEKGTYSDTYRILNIYEKSIIQESDLNMDSAAHPAIFAHTFYLSMGKNWDDRDYPLFLGSGASYEFGRSNAVMNRWLLWIKGGVSF